MSEQVSKALSFWLRHKPDAAGLDIDPSGWAVTDDVIAALNDSGLPHDRAEIEQLVAQSDKQRFELSGDKSLIRARQGHSIAVNLDWPLADPPPVLFHGTVNRYLGAIMREGLKPMRRHHVHLSADTETAKKVGSRRGEPVILEVNARTMVEDGITFRLSSNGVWLVDSVAIQYLRWT